MKIRLLYFAAARERVKESSEDLQVAAGTTVSDIMQRINSRLGHDLASRVRVAVNEEFVSLEYELHEGDEVALIPPIAGGSSAGLIRQTPLSVDEAIASVRDPGAGATCVFLGIVRNQNASRPVQELQYEAYREMCERVFAQIEIQARDRFGARLAILHRVGKLAVGEVAVIVAAAAAHRAEAFAACRYGIDTLKETAPIWKKEIGPDGEEWVGCG